MPAARVAGTCQRLRPAQTARDGTRNPRRTSLRSDDLGKSMQTSEAASIQAHKQLQRLLSRRGLWAYFSRLDERLPPGCPGPPASFISRRCLVKR